MRSAPLIAQLPALVTAEGWFWQQARHLCDDFWYGTDNSGRRWLVKPRGAYYSYREHVFGSLAQHLGLSCQSSVLLIIPPESAPREHDRELGAYHIALELLEEHSHRPCCEDCAARRLDAAIKATGDRVAAMEASGVRSIGDWVSVDALACLCGANEPSDRLITADHEFVIVDSDQMFSTGPAEIDTCWLNPIDGIELHRAREITGNTCASLAALTDAQIGAFTALPEAYPVEGASTVRDRLLAAREAAAWYHKSGFFANEH